jgi:hypothetical protein
VFKPRRIIQVVLIACCLFAFMAQPLQAAPGSALPSSPLPRPFDRQHWEWVNQEIPDTYQHIAENALFALYANPETLAFKVLDKRSGYIWHSNLDELEEGDRLNRTWTAFARSGISIDFLDQKALSKRASITNTEHAIEFTLTEQGFDAAVTFVEPSISMLVVVRLEEHGVSVEIPFSGIRQNNPQFRLGDVYVYPFFGATRYDQIPGYMFIPDGSGSLIRFRRETKAKNMFYGRYYGSDLGMLTELPWDPNINRAYRLSLPVLGMVHGEKENAYIAIVEKGASYGELHVHPAGVTTNFNFMHNTFIYNESFFQATNRSGAGVTTLQRQTNMFDVKIQYRFLTREDSDYVGMARSYRQYLIEQGRLKQTTFPTGNIGIRLEFLAGEKERVLLWDRFIPMTTISQMEEILNALEIANPDIIYYGWQPKGASSMPPQHLKLERSVGTTAQLRSFIAKVSASGGKFSLYYDPQAAIWQEKGYSSRRELAMSITNSNLLGYNRFKRNYYFNYDAVNRRYAALSKGVFTELNAGFALDGIGSSLYSDFKQGSEVNREAAILGYQSILAKNPGRTSFYAPNDYLFEAMDAYYDMPLASSGYIYTTDDVPFLQIVLSGMVPYYGSALNFSSNTRDDLLRHADYGVYPSFFLTHEATAKILRTRSNWIYSSSYVQWSEEVSRTYQWLNHLLGPVTGAEIVARETVAPGVTATTYSNGKKIIVNYRNTTYTNDGISINGKNAVLTEVVP